jgi:hypothetical protein
MWLSLYVALLIWTWLYSLLHTRLHLFVMASVAYAFHYFLCVYNVSEPRSWPWFRGLALWNHLHRRHLGGIVWAEGSKWVDYESKAPHIFVVEATAYDVVAMVLTFGLHGQKPKALRNISPLLVLPDHLFRYPLLANVLQWAGGVPWDRMRLERMIKEGGASLVLVLPKPSDDVLERADATDYLISEWLFTLPALIQQVIKVVPVHYVGADTFYLSPLPRLHLGLFFTCLPRAVSLKTALGTPIALGPPPPDAVALSPEQLEVGTLAKDAAPSSSMQLLDSVRIVHGHLAKVLEEAKR